MQFKENIYFDAYYYEGSYVHPLTHGKIRYKKRGYATQKAAREAEVEFLKKVNDVQTTELTVNDIFDMYIKNRKNVIKERSISDFTYLYNKMIKDEWGMVKISDITTQRIVKWQDHLLEATYQKPLKTNGKIQKDIDGETIFVQERYSNEYLRNIQNLLKQLLNFCIIMGINVPINVLKFKIVTNKKELKKEMNFWEPEEFDKFISMVDNKMYKAFFCILFWEGLRCGEALALTLDDISIEENSIRVNKTYDQANRIVTAPKTSNSYRVVLMTEECRNAVIDWMNEMNYYDMVSGQLLFGDTKPLDDNTIRRRKDKWCEKVNVKRIRIHDFRHSHVSLLINLGFSAFSIAKRLGHSTDEVNNRYGHLFRNVQNEMVTRIDVMRKKKD